MPLKVIVMIDGGHLRALSHQAQKSYGPRLIEKFALACRDPQQEEILRILYYDCAPYTGTVALPVSLTPASYAPSRSWLPELADKDLFAVRLGHLRFRGFVRNNKIPLAPGQQPTDLHYKPIFKQKGVDLRLGLDVTNYSNNSRIDRILLVIGDTDLVPAMKHARKAGLQVVLIQVGNNRTAAELRQHADYLRKVPLP